MLTFEVPALAAIAATPRPNAFVVQSRALSVPMPNRPGLTAIVAWFTGEAVTFTEDPKTKTYAGEAVVLARVTDATGTPMAKQSQQYQLTGPLDDLAKAKAGNLVFFRTPDLPPGQFTVTTAVHDSKGKRSSVVETSVEVPGGTQPVVGSLFVVARVERLDPKDPSAASHPLAGQGVLLYPSFGDPSARRRRPRSPLRCRSCLTRRRQRRPRRWNCCRQGQVLAQIPLPLDKPDANGRLIQTSGCLRPPFRQANTSFA